MAGGRQFIFFVDGAQFVQGLIAVANLPIVGRIKKRKLLDASQPQRLHLQDDAGEVGPPNLRVGKLRPLHERFLRIEANADAGSGSPASPLALVGRGLRYGFNRQALHRTPAAIARHPRQSGVDHILDSRHRQRSLGDVGAKDDARMIVVGKNPHLFLGRQPGIERQHLHALGMMFPQHLGRFANIPLAGEKDKRIARTLLPQLVHSGNNRLLLLIVLLVGRRFVGAIAELDRIGSPFDMDDGDAAKVVGEAFGGDGGRGDNQLQVRPARQQTLQIADKEVDIQRPFVRLIKDDGVILPQHAVGGDLCQQNAVGHQLDQAAGRDLIGKTDLEPHQCPDMRIQFIGNAFGHRPRCDAAWLGVADHALNPAPELQAYLGNLRRLARTGRPAKDDDLIVGNRPGDLARLHGHRQICRVADARHRRPPPVGLLKRTGQILPNPR